MNSLTPSIRERTAPLPGRASTSTSKRPRRCTAEDLKGGFPSLERARARPAHRSDDGDNQEKSLQRTNRQGQKCAKSEEKVEPRQGQKQLRDAHQSIVPPTAKVTCRRADAQANGQSTPRSQEAGEQRNLAAIQEPGELIPAVSIRSEYTNARVF